MNPILIAARLLFPLLILVYPLFGGSLAVALDNLDWYTKELFHLAPLGDYQLVDKVLDIYYLTFLALVATHFTNTVIKRLLLGLFVFRLIGFFLFEFTQIRILLFFFPNLFESFFFLYYIIKRIAGHEPRLTNTILVVIFTFITIPKMLQEYSIHIIDRPLFITISGMSFKFQNTWHQIAIILIMGILFGFWYRKKGNSQVSLKQRSQ